MNCVTRFQCLRGTTSERLSFTPLVAELVFDVTMGQMFVGDGTTVGGIPFTSNASRITSSTTVDKTIVNEDFLRGFGTALITITLPDANANTKNRSIKHIGTQDLTIVCVGGQTIDGNANITLRGGKKQSATLESQGGQWWIA